MSNASAAFLAPGPRDQDPLLEDLKNLVRQHAHAHPRHAQVALGPSQVGHPCARNVISGLLAGKEHEVNPQFDPLPSYVGVAGHRAMEDAAALDNQRLYHDERCTIVETGLGGRRIGRWLAETKVTVREGLSGTCDLYDTWTNTVIDYKFPGTTTMTEYRKNGPTPLYKIQAHLYGRGYRNAGYPVERVGIWFLPRGGLLSTSLLWTEPYSDETVNDVLAKLDSMIVLMDELQLDSHPERLALVPINPYKCTWCPFFDVTGKHTATNPYACVGGSDYLPTITNHSGMAPITGDV